MKRLTEKDWKDKCEGYPWNVHPVKDIDDLPYYKKLAAYEDAEEQGLLLRLPCKVGDTVYAPTRNFVSELRIILISIERDNVFFHWRLNTGIYPNLNGFTASDIGKMVFFTCEEAEAKLKEISCFQNGNS